MSLNRTALAERIIAEAHELGFDLAGIVPAGPPTTAGHYRAWLEKGYHGQMAYVARPDAVARREDLERVMPGVRSVLVVGANHFTGPLPPELSGDPARGIISSYAWGDDYHDVLLPRLHRLAALVETETGQPVAHRAYVDTGPVLERDLAARAGLGFVGKNTSLIHPRLGSWFFLAELLLTVEIPPVTSVRPCLPTAATKDSSVRQGLLTAAEEGSVGDLAQQPGTQHLAQDLGGSSARQGLLTAAGEGSVRDLAQQPGTQQPGTQDLAQRFEVQFLDAQSPGQGTCGRCTRCLDACPTGALVAPYILDARRCISYLTIELKGPIPPEFRPQIGNRIFGCDICQEICPWNRRFAQPTPEPAFQPRPDGMAPLLLDLIALDDEGFRRRFRGSPVMRAKRRGLLRNVAVALGNWGDPAAVPALARALHDPEPLIRGHAGWALGRIGTVEARQALVQALSSEADGWVREELAQVP